MNSSTSNSDCKNPVKSRVKQYLLGVLVFGVSMLALDRGLFYLFFNVEVNVYRKGNFESKLTNYLKEREFSTLILGTSRTYEGIHPVYFKQFLGQKAYKEAFVGKGPRYNYYFYQLYKKHAGIPKVVVYGVDYFIYTIKSDRKWMARLNVNEPEGGLGWFSHPLLLLAHKDRIDTFINNLTSSGNDPKIREIQAYRGVNSKTKSLDNQRPPDSVWWKQHFPRYPGTEGRYFTRLLDLLEKDGVTVILVSLPDYIATFKTNFQRRDFMTHLKRLQDRHQNIHIRNYNKPAHFKLENRAYFNDGGYGLSNSHLSKKGAAQLNKILVKDIKKHY